VTPQNMVTPSPSAGNTGPSPSPNP
jgi:hypothetical protein